jgi:hypothetical protein
MIVPSRPTNSFIPPAILTSCPNRAISLSFRGLGRDCPAVLDTSYGQFAIYSIETVSYRLPSQAKKLLVRAGSAEVT